MTMDESVIAIDDWLECYPSVWRGLIITRATEHPAKFSSKLIRKIYQHILEEGWVSKGDSVLDVFGGVGLGALDAMRLGLNWTGVELEPKYHELGFAEYQCPGFTAKFWKRIYSRPNILNELRKHFMICPDCESLFEPKAKLHKKTKFVIARAIPSADPHIFRGNIPLWNYRYSNFPGWGSAQLIQGDSRNLSEILFHSHDSAISSPPYNETTLTVNRQFSSMREPNRPQAKDLRNKAGKVYGQTPGQLGQMKQGDFAAMITSPPFRQTSGGTNPSGTLDSALMKRHSAGNAGADGYGKTQGQLANMNEGNFDQAVASPPYEKSLPQADRDFSTMRKHQEEKHGRDMSRAIALMESGNYGDTPGQMGQSEGLEFWSAARAIVEQVFINLKPGGHSVWIVKDYVKDWQIVPFCNQWRQLCESVGFITLHEHHAQLSRHRGTSYTLEGGKKEHIKTSKSFFRRVRESKGSPSIDYETIFCMEKPA